MLALILIAVLWASHQPETHCQALAYPTDPVLVTVHGDTFIVPDGIKGSVTCKN